MPVYIKITDSDRQIEQKFLNACKRQLDLAMRQAVPSIRTRIGDIAVALIEGTAEYMSLLHGELLGELGIPHVETRLHEILAAVARGVTAWVTPLRVVNGGLEGGIAIGCMRSDYMDILSLSSASYVSPPSGSDIEWLKWLLVEGDRIIVLGYDVNWNLSESQKQSSRTGKALMIKDGASWHVPEWATGTAEDNFLLRAFNVPGVEKQIARILEEEIGNRLR